jgi:hypothetical protein
MNKNIITYIAGTMNWEFGIKTYIERNGNMICCLENTHLDHADIYYSTPPKVISEKHLLPK